MNTPYTMATMTFMMVDSLYRSFWSAWDPQACETMWPKAKPNDPDIGYSSHFVENSETV